MEEGPSLGCDGPFFVCCRGAYLLKSTLGAVLFSGLPLKYSSRTW